MANNFIITPSSSSIAFDIAGGNLTADTLQTAIAQLATRITDFAGPPSAAPTTLGDVWIDTTNDVAYIAVGISVVGDWKLSVISTAAFLQAANNLSDLANAGTSRTNLGLGNVDNTADSAKAFTAAQTTSGVFDIARLATGTPTGTKFVRDDGTLAVPAGAGGITDLTGGVTASGSGSVVATVVTNANLTGPITSTGNATAITVNAVTNAKLAQMATLTIKGNNTGGASDPLDLTATQTTAILNAMVGDSGAGGTKGLVPAPSAGDAAASKFLKADGTWAVTAGGGGITDLTGGVTASGSGSVVATVVTNANLTGDVTSVGNATTIGTNAVTNAKAAQMATLTIKGNNTGGTANAADLTAAQTKTLLAIANTDVSGLGTLSTQSGTFSGTSSGTNTGDQTITLTGGVTGSGTGSFAATVITNANLTGGVTSVGNAATVITNANLTGTVTSVGNATSIANGAISNAMLANGAVANLSGTNTGDQTISDATITTTDITTNDFTTAKHGFVPKGTNVGNFLKDDGTWSAIAGGGDMVLASVQTVTGAKTFGTIGGAVGKLILAGSTSGSTILNAAAIAGSTTITLPDVSGDLAVNPMTTGGDLIYGGASGLETRLANGTAGQVLQSNGTTLAPTWVTPAAGSGPTTGKVFNIANSFYNI